MMWMTKLSKFWKKLGEKRQRVLVLVIIGLGLLWAIYLMVLNKPFRYAGTLEATKVDLSARLSAAIQTLNVDEGDRVKTEEVLVLLACEDFKLTAQLTHNTYERNLALSKSGYVSEEQLDNLKTEMSEAKTRVDWCTIRSPISGKVLNRYHEPGEWMNPGTKILTLANIQDIWTYIYVPQPRVARLSLGMVVTGKVAELGDRPFQGKIIHINDEAEFTPKNVQTQNERERLVYGVKISFLGANSEEILKPGMTIEIQLPAKRPE